MLASTQSALPHHSTQAGTLNGTAQALLKSCSSVLGPSLAGLTPLHLAIISLKISPLSTNRSVLQAAIKEAPLEAIEAIFGEGNTALHLACALGDVDTASLLISRGANVSHRNKLGFSPRDLSRDSNVLSSTVCGFSSPNLSERRKIQIPDVFTDQKSAGVANQQFGQVYSSPQVYASPKPNELGRSPRLPARPLSNHSSPNPIDSPYGSKRTSFISARNFLQDAPKSASPRDEVEQQPKTEATRSQSRVTAFQDKTVDELLAALERPLVPTPQHFAHVAEHPTYDKAGDEDDDDTGSELTPTDSGSGTPVSHATQSGIPEQAKRILMESMRNNTITTNTHGNGLYTSAHGSFSASTHMNTHASVNVNVTVNTNANAYSNANTANTAGVVDPDMEISRSRTPSRLGHAVQQKIDELFKKSVEKPEHSHMSPSLGSPLIRPIQMQKQEQGERESKLNAMRLHGGQETLNSHDNKVHIAEEKDVKEEEKDEEDDEEEEEDEDEDEDEEQVRIPTRIEKLPEIVPVKKEDFIKQFSNLGIADSFRQELEALGVGEVIEEAEESISPELNLELKGLDDSDSHSVSSNESIQCLSRRESYVGTFKLGASLEPSLSYSPRLGVRAGSVAASSLFMPQVVTVPGGSAEATILNTASLLLSERGESHIGSGRMILKVSTIKNLSWLSERFGSGTPMHISIVIKTPRERFETKQMPLLSLKEMAFDTDFLLKDIFPGSTIEVLLEAHLSVRNSNQDARKGKGLRKLFSTISRRHSGLDMEDRTTIQTIPVAICTVTADDVFLRRASRSPSVADLVLDEMAEGLTEYPHAHGNPNQVSGASSSSSLVGSSNGKLTPRIHHTTLNSNHRVLHPMEKAHVSLQSYFHSDASTSPCPESMEAAREFVKRRDHDTTVFATGALNFMGVDGTKFWKRKYFVLKGFKLTGYHEENKDPQIFLEISPDTKVLPKATEDEDFSFGGPWLKHSFRVASLSGAKSEVVSFYCDSEVEMENWISGLKRSVAGLSTQDKVNAAVGGLVAAATSALGNKKGGGMPSSSPQVSAGTAVSASSATRSAISSHGPNAATTAGKRIDTRYGFDAATQGLLSERGRSVGIKEGFRKRTSVYDSPY